ncbi:MAG: preprotein translocase subunit SecA [Planctomycetes bacterium]|nr:preprotein translocase subunit SecA [Planctomycetota bacterium]
MKLDLGSIPQKLGKALQGLFGSANQRALNVYQPVVKATNELAGWAEGLSDDQVREQVAQMKEQVQKGELSLDDAMPRMFALTRVAAQRTIGLRHFDVQLIGGAVLHQGKIAEMSTGEGKTLVATLPAALNALTGRGVYVVTVNDYLAKRDRDWMAPVYEFLGLSVGAIQSSMPPQLRQPMYACDILYGTNNEFGFDYLRDNMKWRAEDQVQKRLYFAIVDEVDSILIDEARTPLIISGEGEGSTDRFVLADRIARQLKVDEHFEVKLKEQQCILNEAGIERAEKLVGVDSFYSDPAYMEWPHLLETSLRAHHIYERDKNYVVVQPKGPDGQEQPPEVVIVDEFTGRLMPGRRWSDGLHQSVEAKEGLPPREENRTLATITLQNYFRMFEKLAGMTGTAMTEASEFSRIYDLDVVAIPTNRPNQRKDINDQVYLDDDSKFDAIVEEIRAENEKGRPVLLGTTSIAKSEKISDKLKAAGIPHSVLNAKHHEREAEIITQAGRKGAVTVATNMAGRGTDIVLGGKADALWETQVKERGLAADSAEAKQLLTELKETCKREHDELLELGGLYVIGTERHEARRIDNQLRGRCGRQGDPGQTKFFLSFDDDLMRIFARDWVRTMMERMGLKAGEVIDSPMVTRGIAKAQKKVEARNFDVRKHLLEYDEVMDKQRKFVYAQRQEALESRGLRDKVLGMFEEVLEPVVERYSADKDKPVDYAEIVKWIEHRCDAALSIDGIEQAPREQLFSWIMERVEKLHDVRGEQYGEDWEKIERFLIIETIDNKWKDHLYAMEALKHGVGLRGYAQIDPKNEYKKEGYEKFQQLKTEIADHVTGFVFKQEATDTIRDLVTGKLRQQAPAPQPQQMRMPQTQEELQALFESLIAAGKIPQEVLDRMQSGERFVLRATPQGLVLQPAPVEGGEGGEAAAGPAGDTGSPGGLGARAAAGAARSIADPAAARAVAGAGGAVPRRARRSGCGARSGAGRACRPPAGASVRRAEARAQRPVPVRFGHQVQEVLRAGLRLMHAPSANDGPAVPPLPMQRSGLRGWMTMAVYQPLFALLFLLYSPVLVWRLAFARSGRRTNLRERMGFVARRLGERPLIWIHGVSVGEVKAASDFVAELRRARPDLDLIVSTTTPNGRLVAQQEYPDLPVVFYPLDFANFPARALRRLRPRCVLLMELEIWPNFLQAARNRDVPVAVINGRISERTFKGYRLARGLLPQLDLISKYCVQDRVYRERLLQLGVDPARVFVTGNMKYDSVVLGRHQEGADALRRWLASGDARVLVAGSTHDDEEAQVLDAVAASAATPDGPPVRVVLVPRHPERSTAVCEVVEQRGRRAVRWSELRERRDWPPLGASDVVVVDTIGQLQRFYAACDVAFVGGSLIPHGGQNMLEPAALGRAVLFGPHTTNFRRDVELLLAAEGVVQVGAPAEFPAALDRLLRDDAARQALGARARQVIADNQGATRRTLELVEDLLGVAPTAR